jgi:hypothetical protein
MDQAVRYIVGSIVVALFVVLAFYVTWLFVERLRSKESPTRSFLHWLRDLMDLLWGLG